MTTNTIRRIVVTAGEPAGIGPDLVLALSKEDWAHQIVVCADKNMLTERAKQLGIEVQLSDYNPEETPKAQKSGTLIVDHIQISEPAVAGELNEANGHYVLKTLERAALGCMNDEFDAIVTGLFIRGG